MDEYYFRKNIANRFKYCSKTIQTPYPPNTGTSFCNTRYCLNRDIGKCLPVYYRKIKKKHWEDLNYDYYEIPITYIDYYLDLPRYLIPYNRLSFVDNSEISQKDKWILDSLFENNNIDKHKSHHNMLFKYDVPIIGNILISQKKDKWVTNYESNKLIYRLNKKNNTYLCIHGNKYNTDKTRIYQVKYHSKDTIRFKLYGIYNKHWCDEIKKLDSYPLQIFGLKANKINDAIFYQCDKWTPQKEDIANFSELNKKDFEIIVDLGKDRHITHIATSGILYDRFHYYPSTSKYYESQHIDYNIRSWVNINNSWEEIKNLPDINLILPRGKVENNSNYVREHYVKKYRLYWRTHKNKKWTLLDTFIGNRDNYNIKVYNLEIYQLPPLQYLKFVPLPLEKGGYQNSKSMKIGVYGPIKKINNSNTITYTKELSDVKKWGNKFLRNHTDPCKKMSKLDGGRRYRPWYPIKNNINRHYRYKKKLNIKESILNKVRKKI